MSKNLNNLMPFALFMCVAVSGCGNSIDEVSVSDYEELPPPKFDADNDSPWWRGPTRDGKSTSANPPVEWSDSQNVVWKADVPGKGHGSPTVWGDMVFLATADDDKQTQSVLCYSRVDGDLLWQKQVHSGGYPDVHDSNTRASATIAVDGERAFSLFENHDALWVTALDFKGKQIWQTKVGPIDMYWGYGASPLVYKSLVIVAGDGDSDAYLAAMHRGTGKIIWRVKRPNQGSYSSPVVTNIDGKDQLLLSGNSMVASYDPATGETLWTIDATTKTTCGTIVWDGDLVFASGGYPDSSTVAVRADGGSIVWQNSNRCYEQSMLAHDGYIYAIIENGIALCYDAKTGEEQWKKRLGGNESASLVLAGGNLYGAMEDGTVHVFAASPGEFKRVAKNKLGDEAMATPTICGNQMFARVAFHGDSRSERLYCIARAEALAAK